jgi:hypothetical protein
LFEKAKTEFSINLLGGLYEVITKGYRSVNIEFVYLSLFSHSRKKKTILAYLAPILYTEINAKNDANCFAGSQGYARRSDSLHFLYLHW